MFRVFEMFKMCDPLLVLITWLWALRIVQGSTLPTAHRCSPEKGLDRQPTRSSVCIFVMNPHHWLFSFNCIRLTCARPVLLPYQFLAGFPREIVSSFLQRKFSTCYALILMPDFIFVLHSYWQVPIRDWLCARNFTVEKLWCTLKSFSSWPAVLSCSERLAASSSRWAEGHVATSEAGDSSAGPGPVMTPVSPLSGSPLLVTPVSSSCQRAVQFSIVPLGFSHQNLFVLTGWLCYFSLKHCVSFSEVQSSISPMLGIRPYCHI